MTQPFNWRLLFLSSLFSIILIYDLHGQPVYSLGKVIDLQGDTITGYIAEFGNGRNYETCYFRKSLKTGLKAYSPKEIKSYWLEDRRYFKSITFDNAEGKEINLFFEILVEGAAHTLMKHKKGYYYFDSLQQVKQVPIQLKKNAAHALTVNDYINGSRAWYRYLQDFTRKCPDLREAFKIESKIRATEDNLIDIVKAYNSCLDAAAIEYGDRLPRAVVRMGVTVGGSAQRLAIQSSFPENQDIYNGVVFQQVTPEIGFSFITANPRKLAHFSLAVEPGFRAYQFVNSTQKTFTSSFQEETQYIDWRTTINSIRFPVSIRYAFPYFRPYFSIQAGPVIDFHLSQKINNRRDYQLKRLGENYIVSSDPVGFPQPLSAFQLGAQIRVNISNKRVAEKNRWELSAGLEPGMGIFQEDYFPSSGFKLESSQIAVSVRFHYFL